MAANSVPIASSPRFCSGRFSTKWGTKEASGNASIFAAKFLKIAASNSANLGLSAISMAARPERPQSEQANE